MSEKIADYEILITVRVYGPASAEDAVQAFREYGETFDLPHESECEIMSAQLVKKEPE